MHMLRGQGVCAHFMYSTSFSRHLAAPSLLEWLEQHSPDSSKNRAAAYMLWYSAQKRSRKNAAVSGRTPAR